MRDKLHAYLLERPAGASPRELLDLVFTQPGSDPEFGPRFVHGLLSGDARFVWRETEGRWGARLHEALAQPLRDTTLVVCDIETTGMTASPAGIIEIGAARLRGGRVIEEFQQLVNPGVRLPPFITRLTGIDDAMLVDQPPLADVWRRFHDFLGSDVLIAHNAKFDLSFLNAAAVAYAGRPLPNPWLCTLKLARRVLPQQRRRGLDALAAHFAIPQNDRHRALGDVRITVEILFHLLELLAARGIVRLDQALDLQNQARDGRPFICLLRREKVERLPSAPGIYQLFDGDGRLLYIGKAKSLRDRVGNYLSNAAGHSDKTLDLIRHSRDVRVQVTGSELDAALTEAEAIRQHKPPYNRLGKHLPRVAYLKLTVGDRFPRLFITNRLAAGTARYIGPFRGREQAEQVLSLLTRQFRLRGCAGPLAPDAAIAPCFQGQVGACTAPCAARVSVEAYRQQVDDCLALLQGDGETTARALIQRRDGHTTALRFEAAARAQRDLDLLDVLTRRQRALGWIAAQRSFLILQPTVDRGALLAYVVLSGRLAFRAPVYDESEVPGLVEKVAAQLPLYQSTSLRRDEVEGTTILAAWLRDRGETDGCVLPISAAPATQLSEWRAACAALLAPSAVDANAHPSAAPQPDGDREGGEQPRARAIGAAAAD